MKTNPIIRFAWAVSLSFLTPLVGGAQDHPEECSIRKNDSLLVISNSRIRLALTWKEGDLRMHSLASPESGKTWTVAPPPAAGPVPVSAEMSAQPELNVLPVTDHPWYPDHLAGEVTTRHDGFHLKRTFRVYPGVAAVSITWNLKKTGDGTDQGEGIPVESLRFPGNHWKYRSIEFLDNTDQNNNLVQENNYLGFTKPLKIRGNILISEDLNAGERIFFIKESPLGENQLSYPGADFEIIRGEVTVLNLGALYPEVEENSWYRCYGAVVGIGGTTELETLGNMRQYMKHVRRSEDSGEMIMLNTWGDRGQDGRISESFALGELEMGAALGITHFQLDDGWQQGLSKNSSALSGQLWDRWQPEDWDPHPSRFPHGLAPVVEQATDQGIAMGLWFHPSNADSYASWEQDADILIDLYDHQGISVFKIDGMELPDKRADLRMRSIFETVAGHSEGKVLFNLDATAGRRGGYFYLNEFGNLFLENRYTDWGNYYPHWTLRNLWQLSRYVPPEKLQIEFLNKWRNPHRYDPADPLRPGGIPFAYIFATAMAGQPLAWMELANLPPEAYAIAPLIKAYREIMTDFHEGCILPLGDEPDGYSWTGFQSIRDNRSGYFLIYRENHPDDELELETFLPEATGVKLKKIAGAGSPVNSDTGPGGSLRFSLPEPFSFLLCKYEIAH